MVLLECLNTIKFRNGFLNRFVLLNEWDHFRFFCVNVLRNLKDFFGFVLWHANDTIRSRNDNVSWIHSDTGVLYGDVSS